MTNLNRRAFLGRGSLTVVAAGLATTMPALTSTATTVAPEAEATVSDTASLDGPLIAQVTDLQRGAISLFSGEQEITILDKALAAKLFNAAQ